MTSLTAEDTIHLSHRAWRNQFSTDLEASFLLVGSHRHHAIIVQAAYLAMLVITVAFRVYSWV